MAAQPASTLKVAIEHHFLEVDGRIYTDLAFNAEYWREYLEVFRRVEPIARVGSARTVPPGWVQADGPDIVFHRVYDYLGFWQFWRCLPRVLRDCRCAVARPGPVLMRMGNISLFCWLHLRLARRPYAFEVVGHAGNSAAKVKNVQILGLGGLIGAVLHWFCRMQAAHAACASYVSEYVRRLYPTRSGREFVFSSVRLPESAFRPPREARDFEHRPKRLVSVGRLEPEKGHRVLVDAAAELRRRGRTDFTVDIVGPGSELAPLRQLVGELDLADRVRLLGRVPPGEPVCDILDQSDLFVLPSLTEGLPRALLEAMARGLPALGSRAGGVVELLSSESLAEPGSSRALADRIVAAIDSPERLAAMSRANFQTARGWHRDVMRRRMLDFWQCIVRTC